MLLGIFLLLGSCEAAACDPTTGGACAAEDAETLAEAAGVSILYGFVAMIVGAFLQATRKG